ncbi:hypothetical protein [Nonomuraea sp. SBT364]|uniref:hypothetical protein n=1 Tax=Nonomuraea sp. SBT364 TaxID=1580530 RepID=UPI0012E26876|nr:hypothetical protein [Nonomuraea sp. SBT364]
MRVHGRLQALALTVALLTGAAGCSSAAAPAPSPAATARSATPTPSPTAPVTAVTPEEAAEVFATFAATDDLLRAGGDLRLAMELTRDAEARLTAAAFLSTSGKPPRRAWGSPTLYVPRFPVGERAPWFSVVADRDGGPTMLTFAKSGDWRLSSAARLLPDQELPPVALDADGYATAIPAADKTITISPQYLGPLHATVAEAGGDGVAAGLIAAGPYTTEVAAQITADREQAKKNGFSYDSIFTANDFPVYGLRTTDGGALIQYALSRTTTTTTKTAEDDYIPVPSTARWAISSPVVRRTLRLTEVHQYVTSVPPSTTREAAAVVAHDGSLTRASGD